jgi:hypothetical protein
VLFHRREVVVERVEALLRAMVRRRHRVAPPSPYVFTRSVSPLDWVGSHLWRRPPPLLLDI